MTRFSRWHSSRVSTSAQCGNQAARFAAKGGLVSILTAEEQSRFGFHVSIGQARFMVPSGAPPPGADAPKSLERSVAFQG